MRDSVLVTGGAGYIGSHVCKRLAADGWTPVTYDNLSTGHRWAVKWGPLEEGDIRDRARLDEVIACHRPVAVMHFAALSLVGDSMRDPGRYYCNNVTGSLILLEAMQDAGIASMVFSSTCAVYGEPRAEVLDESHPCEPVNPYGATKLAIERMLSDFEQAQGPRFVALRYFNAAGADPNVEIGEAHEPETHLIPLVLQAASGRCGSITVYGNDYPTPDGTCIRDYIDVTDLADAHVRALSHLMNGGPSLTVNLGTGHGHSVLELLSITSRVVGREIPWTVGSRRQGDPARLVAGSQLAQQWLGWRARTTNLEETIRNAWNWEKAFSEGTRSCKTAS